MSITYVIGYILQSFNIGKVIPRLQMRMLSPTSHTVDKLQFKPGINLVLFDSESHAF